MAKVSEHFDSKEFACKCGCGLDKISPATVSLLEKIRAAAGNKTITITSGCRCAKHNKAVGGAKKSEHMPDPETGECIAADIKARGMTPKAVAAIAERFLGNSGGIGIYKSWTHVDTRKTKSRWNG
jgi:uncharacterized protein YcbK (DUF882 family)